MAHLRLARASLEEIKQRKVNGKAVVVPDHDIAEGPRICHLGMGAFQRSHQAFALHRLHQRALCLDWGIVGIGLRLSDRALHEALTAQDGLYSLWTLDGTNVDVEIVGSVVEHIDACSDVSAALAAMAAPLTRIISLTVTEAGYCLGSDGQLDLEHPDIVHDLANPQSPRSAIGMLVRALEMRRTTLAGGLTALSCDNIIANGKKLRSSLVGFAIKCDRSLADWILENVRFPCSMVDRITPAMTEERRLAFCAEAGFEDLAPVACEAWFQWIIEDDFAAGRPLFEQVGVVFSDDVERFETMKVGLLNGSHSALSHAALLLGYHSVHEAVADPMLRAWLQAYMHEVAETLQAPSGIDLETYSEQLLCRFSNAAIADRLQRLAQDTREKFRQALVPPVMSRLRRNQPAKYLSLAISLWIHFLRTLVVDRTARDSYQDTDSERLIEAALANDIDWLLITALGIDPDASAAVRGDIEAHLNGLGRDLRRHLSGQL